MEAMKKREEKKPDEISAEEELKSTNAARDFKKLEPMSESIKQTKSPAVTSESRTIGQESAPVVDTRIVKEKIDAGKVKVDQYYAHDVWDTKLIEGGMAKERNAPLSQSVSEANSPQVIEKNLQKSVEKKAEQLKDEIRNQSVLEERKREALLIEERAGRIRIEAKGGKQAEEGKKKESFREEEEMIEKMERKRKMRMGILTHLDLASSNAVTRVRGLVKSIISKFFK